VIGRKWAGGEGQRAIAAAPQPDAEAARPAGERQRAERARGHSLVLDSD